MLSRSPHSWPWVKVNEGQTLNTQYHEQFPRAPTGYGEAEQCLVKVSYVVTGGWGYGTSMASVLFLRRQKSRAFKKPNAFLLPLPR